MTTYHVRSTLFGSPASKTVSSGTINSPSMALPVHTSSSEKKCLEVIQEAFQRFNFEFNEKVYGNGKPDGTAHQLLEALKTVTVPHTDFSCFGLSNTQYNMSDNDCFIKMSDLKTKSEKECQDAFDKKWKKSGQFYYKSCTTAHFFHKLPFEHTFLLLDGQSCTKTLMQPSARPDILSTVAPVIAEIKRSDSAVIMSDIMWDVLVQAMERLDVAGRCYGTLREVYVFAITGNAAFLLQFVRSHKSLHRYGTIAVFYLGDSDDLLNGLWRDLTEKCKANRDTLLVQEDGVISQVLNTFGYDRCAARIHLLGKSCSSVYGITFPRKRSIKGQEKWTVECGFTHLCIKVIKQGSAYEDEKKVSKEIVRNLKQKYPTFKSHILGFYDDNSREVEWLTDEKYGKDKTVPPRVTVKTKKGKQIETFWQSVSGLRGCGGILMIVAEPIPEVLTLAEVRLLIDGVVQSLQRLWSINYCQRDVRRANVVKLNNVYQVIDYGLAVKNGTKVTIDRIQFKNCGRRVVTAALKAGTVSCQSVTLEQIESGEATVSASMCTIHCDQVLEDYEWTRDDDHEMMTVMVNKILESQ